MKKTCYFCQYFRGIGKEFCIYANAVDDACTPEISTRPFLPTDDWLEYESLLNVKQLAKDMIIPIKLLQEQSDSGFHVISVEGQQKMIDQSETSRDKLLEIFEKEGR